MSSKDWDKDRREELEKEHYEGEEDVCEFCGKTFNSEYHMSDECVNYEDSEDLDG